MNKVVVIVGPTGIGKTKLSIELAKFLNSEVINGDAFQIYKGMDIGTAKVREEEKEGIPHHLFDICEVDETFSAFDYQTTFLPFSCRQKSHIYQLHPEQR
jgi:tRNA dimethylallyltransferase